MNETPESRRRFIIESTYTEQLTSGKFTEFDEYDHFDALVAYFDEHEPTVADAIRYGVTQINNYGLETNKAFLINYPEGT